jgi:hypothetical protein
VVANEEAIGRGEIARHAIWSGPVVQARTGVLHQLRGGGLDDFAAVLGAASLSLQSGVTNSALPVTPGGSRRVRVACALIRGPGRHVGV